MFQPFQNFLPKAAQSYGVSKEVQAATLCQYLRTIIPQVFHNKPEADKNITPGFFRENYIVLNVSSPAWAQEVIMRKQKIIDEINKKAGREVIKNLRTQLDSTPNLPKPPNLG